MLIRQACFSRGVIGVICITLTTLVTSVATASAQNIIEALFGSLWSSPVSTAAPNATLPSPEAARSEGGVAFCVRLCDGRYFPIQRHSGASSAQTCSAFCPASATNIYTGNGIAHAVAPDGKRYSELATASAYREKIIPGCTCNGRDAFGLVNTGVAVSDIASRRHHRNQCWSDGLQRRDKRLNLHSHQHLCGIIGRPSPPAYRNEDRAGR